MTRRKRGRITQANDNLKVGKSDDSRSVVQITSKSSSKSTIASSDYYHSIDTKNILQDGNDSKRTLRKRKPVNYSNTSDGNENLVKKARRSPDNEENESSLKLIKLDPSDAVQANRSDKDTHHELIDEDSDSDNFVEETASEFIGAISHSQKTYDEKPTVVDDKTEKEVIKSGDNDILKMLMDNEDTHIAGEIESDSNCEDEWEKVPSPSKRMAKTANVKKEHQTKCSPRKMSGKRNRLKSEDSDFDVKIMTKKRKMKSDGKQPKKKVEKSPKIELSEAEKEIQRFTRRCLKDRESCLEQCSLVMGVAFLRYMVQCSTPEIISAILLSVIPKKLHIDTECSAHHIRSLLDWYRDTYSLVIEKSASESSLHTRFLLMNLITSGNTSYEAIYVASFFAILRSFDVDARYVGSLYVPSVEKVAGNNNKTPKHSPIFWIEVQLRGEFLVVDVVNGVVSEDLFEDNWHSKPPCYVVSVTPQLAVLDSTPRYSTRWSEIHRKARMNTFEFWDSFIADQPLYYPTLKAHDATMKKMMIDRGFPKSLTGFKHNLVFALEKDNLKIEAIYPRDAPVLGTFKSHNIYSRDNVKTLKQIIVIKKEGRAVIEGEVPYKIVKNKIFYDRWPGDDRWKDIPLYGDWQTEWYKAPAAEAGVVPRNEFGNVELFQPWMLPKGTKHVDLAGSYALARRLNIDAAHAVVGFEFPRCRAVPLMRGVVVCEEHAQALENAWVEYSALQVQRAEDKRVKKIYDNWKLLIRSLLIKQKIDKKYSSLSGKGGKPGTASGHIHKFVPRGKDKVTGEKVQKCSCGLIVAMDSCDEEL